MKMPWFWDQNGKTLKVMTREAKDHPKFWGGPFATRVDAIEDALKEYRETVRLYQAAIKDAESRR